MRRLSPKANVIPVIGKSDTLTPSELASFKKRIMEDIEYYGIPVYNFPYDVEEDDEEVIADNSELRALMPFAMVGSEEEVRRVTRLLFCRLADLFADPQVEVNGEVVRARRYPWGVVEVDNPQHSDFQRLRFALLNTHLTDLKELTHDYLYENYRTDKLSRSVQGGEGYSQDQSILPEDMAQQSVRLKEDQLRREGERRPVLSEQDAITDLLLAVPHRGEAARSRAEIGPRAVGKEARAAREGGVAAPPRVAPQRSAIVRGVFLLEWRSVSHLQLSRVILCLSSYQYRFLSHYFVTTVFVHHALKRCAQYTNLPVPIHMIEAAPYQSMTKVEKTTGATAKSPAVRCFAELTGGRVASGPKLTLAVSVESQESFVDTVDVGGLEFESTSLAGKECER